MSSAFLTLISLEYSCVKFPIAAVLFIKCSKMIINELKSKNISQSKSTMLQGKLWIKYGLLRQCITENALGLLFESLSKHNIKRTVALSQYVPEAFLSTDTVFSVKENARKYISLCEVNNQKFRLKFVRRRINLSDGLLLGLPYFDTRIKMGIFSQGWRNYHCHWIILSLFIFLDILLDINLIQSRVI